MIRRKLPKHKYGNKPQLITATNPKTAAEFLSLWRERESKRFSSGTKRGQNGISPEFMSENRFGVGLFRSKMCSISFTGCFCRSGSFSDKSDRRADVQTSLPWISG
ncbi:Protein CBG27122 [Caenorhabditis briggsae]|uniref:Protein CBG27122 n=1 Tax=Caenorhabditis briggsae TaxID=6238 RepID=B6IHJ6_CAEBR|nr:Protein CBG27122 [Caenorhabditis briggsae]CAR99376.1 Protein CBG27122 [Caenorhabditis briggsae]